MALVRKLNHLPVIKPYLSSVQQTNTLAVNEALNELHIEEEDFAALRKSIDAHENYDQIGTRAGARLWWLFLFLVCLPYFYSK